MQFFEKLKESCQPFKESNPEFKDFVKAIKLIDSRAFSQDDGSEMDTYIAPLADFADHSSVNYKAKQIYDSKNS